MAKSSFAFPKSVRLRKHADYLACYDKGKKWHAPHFILRALHDPAQPARFGMAVSKKIGNAVCRNRVKRLLREFFRLSRYNLPGWQIVAIAKAGASDLALANVTEELDPLLRRLEKNSQHG